MPSTSSACYCVRVNIHSSLACHRFGQFLMIYTKVLLYQSLIMKWKLMMNTWKSQGACQKFILFATRLFCCFVTLSAFYAEGSQGLIGIMFSGWSYSHPILVNMIHTWREFLQIVDKLSSSVMNWQFLWSKVKVTLTLCSSYCGPYLWYVKKVLHLTQLSTWTYGWTNWNMN